jgi:hypothetical protein
MSDILPDNNSTDLPIYSPASIVNILANAVSVLGPNRIITLRGI